MIITDEDNNENANELMTRESFDCQNGHYKLTGQCENTISFTFKLLQSNNPISIQILNKFRNWLGVGVEEKFVVGTLPPCPPPSGFGPVAHD